ncbi:hypothetical protein DICSQDRAFT_170782 [Dichomitus squalens LYAD-421 SS1]|uniref:DUF6534 domain-containing protein n=1 Tax=Dichomitus squalens (strain LYAD-421) TaxID=732165 RepID=R7SYV6_DICSQ|nr:uncharacterized protein DICSQDRAFT_170782 [Dichomitus squalens LYAD-421 SS1]EJF60925.1 hypothetical protein DICSQDRAFT_170782 [Dichomitus squalens LYAD-421 SS1]
MYHYAVTEFGDYQGVTKPYWALLAIVIVGALSNAIVRCVYSMRVFKLKSSCRWLVPVILVNVLSFVAFAIGTYFVSQCIELPTLFEIHSLASSFRAGLVTDIAADVVVTASQLVLFRGIRMGLHRWDSVITILMKYTVNTGLLTTFSAVMALITFAELPSNSFVYMAFYFIHSKLYVNSLLATLNARAIAIKHVLEDQEISTEQLLTTGLELAMSNTTTTAPPGQVHHEGHWDTGDRP